MVDYGSQVLPVLLVPADRGRPLQVIRVAPKDFETVLGGPPQPFIPLQTAPPVEWMAFLADLPTAPENLRAQQLSTQLGGPPGRRMRGAVVFTGQAPGRRIRGVPGIFAQAARLLGMQVRLVE